MKKLSVMFILLTLLLTGCDNKNTFDYDTELVISFSYHVLEDSQKN